MYPLKFEKLYYERVWGGRNLELFRDDLPDGKIGESWDVACHPHGTSVISNGKFKGYRLDKLIEEQGSNILGTKISKDRFPLLIKLINASDKLSIQVHPDDKYAGEVENESGKTEAWYVVEAFEGASLIVGTKDGCSREEFKKAVLNGNVEKYLNRVPVKKGDIYFIKSGMVHAICEGVIIAEIQQNSDITYRVYDYNRGRELHIDKALDVIDFSLRGEKSKGISIEMDGCVKTYACLSKEFSLELYDVNECFSEDSDPERFYIFTCVDGSGKLTYLNGEEKIYKGESLLIPASLGKYKFEGKMKLLKSYVPDVSKVEHDILSEIEK